MIRIPRVVPEDLKAGPPLSFAEELLKHREDYTSYLNDKMIREAEFLLELEQIAASFPKIKNTAIFLEWYGLVKNIAPSYLEQFEIDVLVAASSIEDKEKREAFKEFYVNSKCSYEFLSQYPPEVVKEELKKAHNQLRKKSRAVDVKA